MKSIRQRSCKEEAARLLIHYFDVAGARKDWDSDAEITEIIQWLDKLMDAKIRDQRLKELSRAITCRFGHKYLVDSDEKKKETGGLALTGERFVTHHELVDMIRHYFIPMDEDQHYIAQGKVFELLKEHWDFRLHGAEPGEDYKAPLSMKAEGLIPAIAEICLEESKLF